MRKGLRSPKSRATPRVRCIATQDSVLHAAIATDLQIAGNVKRELPGPVDISAFSQSALATDRPRSLTSKPGG